MRMGTLRKTVDLGGVVQGVGFRPALFRLATEAGLGGWIQNRTGDVRLCLEGPRDVVEAFLERLPAGLPANARVEWTSTVSEEPLDQPSRVAFEIRESDDASAPDVVIPADLAMCPDCRREIDDPSDRRYGYPFTTCTCCGPRYSVVTAMPYDRQRTTLWPFALCPDCAAEYHDPGNRRFHAESIACPVCGPSLWSETAGGGRVYAGVLPAAQDALRRGRVVALRGLGGYHLAVDAFNREALARLRHRKSRPHKPFAVMARDLEVVARHCVLTEPAAALLASPRAPIVILDLRSGSGRDDDLPVELISPDTRTLGVMLPTTPLHHLLMRPEAGAAPIDLLVMTSGNRHGEPICIANEEARVRLAGIADLFVMHDRDIHLRCDDSVCGLQGDAPQVWRRARGYAPDPVRLTTPLRRTVLAVGADMKNAVALGHDRHVVLSPHVGDLDTPEAVEGFEQVAGALPGFLRCEPEVIAMDLHPDMQSTRLGQNLAVRRGLPVLAVQHHHAHAMACLAEHGRDQGLVLVMDGTGWGDDGAVWGAELLEVSARHCRRHATFLPAPLPGGDAAVRRPARQVVGRWVQAGIALEDERLAELGVTREEASVWEQQCRQGLLAPMSHAAGRLFDAFSVLLGCAPERMTYEGQPAIRLEAAARRATDQDLPEVPFTVAERQGCLFIDWTPAVQAISVLPREERMKPAWALAFHEAVVRAAEAMINYGFSRVGGTSVGLSGGVFMNRLLNERLVPRLERCGLTVLRHAVTPPGDGCIALGQAVIAGGRT